MILPRVDDLYPMPDRGPHASHEARIVAVDLHGEESFTERPLYPPTLRIRCACGVEWEDDLPEAAVVEPLTPARPARRVA